MADGRQGSSPALTLDARELAARTGTTPERVAELVALGVLVPTGPDRHDVGDVHRMRLIAAFEGAGIPLDALVDASRAGRVTFAYYDELHTPPSPPSERSYAEFRTSLGAHAERLSSLFAALGIAEPTAATRLGIDDEAFLADQLDLLEATGRPEVAERTVRLFAEANRRASEAALGVYAEVVGELGEAFLTMPPEEAYQVLRPWARIAREAPALARWLTAHHMSRAIDAFSATTTERMLEELGYIPERPTVLPGVAFVDLTGFTRLSEEAGDETAASVSLALGELARRVVDHHGGRLVKLLGDGVLLQFPDVTSAVDGALDLLGSLPAAGLPPGHAGVHRGRLIEREGDVFGRTVNLAARIADVAPSTALYVTATVVEAIADLPVVVTPVGEHDLLGIGPVPLFQVESRPGPTRLTVSEPRRPVG